MAVGGVSQNTLLQNNNFSGNNSKPKPFNGGTVSVRTNANATQKDVLRSALIKFAYNAGIRDSAAREAFADRWVSKMGGDAAKLYTNGKPIADKIFSGDKADGLVSVSVVPGEHDALIRDLRNVQVEQKVISFSEANFTPISKQPAKIETPMDSILRSRYEESLVFDPSQMTRQNLEQKYRDGQYEKVAQDPTLSEMALDLTQMGLDIVGIFEPTPFADGANTIISALRGDWGNAALSALGIVPYVGDLAKFGKIPKWIASIKKISAVVDKLKDVVKMGGKAAEAAKGFVSEIRRLLDKIPIEKLPDSLKDAFKSLKKKVDDFFSSKPPDIEPPKKPDLNKVNTTPTVKTEEIIAPSSGKPVKVFTDGDSIVPVDKVEKYVRGKVNVDIDVVNKEIRELNQFKNSQRKLFDQDPKNAARLESLKKMKHNFERSDAMKKTLESIGLADTPQNNKAIAEHLLNTGKQITDANRVDFPSVLQGRNGKVKVLSTWTMVNNKPYLSTIKFIPIK